MQHIAHVTKNAVLTLFPHKGISQRTQLPTQKIIDSFAHRLRTFNIFEETETIRHKRLARFTCECRLKSTKLWWLDANEAFDGSDASNVDSRLIHEKPTGGLERWFYSSFSQSIAASSKYIPRAPWFKTSS